MFHIFSKKRFLVDSLAGFVDIHNHILPGIDDGAKTVEDSLGMLKEFESIGITRLIGTPHIMADYYPNTPETIGKALTVLKSSLLENKMGHIKIEAAAEHMIDLQFEGLLGQDKFLPLQARHLLVEMSYLQASLNFDQVIEMVASKGFFPVLAHPERYPYIQSKKKFIGKYRKKNVLFQLNLLSIGSFYGKEIQKNALELLDAQMFDFAGTDAHNVRQLEKLKEIKISRRTQQKLLPVLENTISEFY